MLRRKKISLTHLNHFAELRRYSRKAFYFDYFFVEKKPQRNIVGKRNWGKSLFCRDRFREGLAVFLTSNLSSNHHYLPVAEKFSCLEIPANWKSLFEAFVFQVYIVQAYSEGHEWIPFYILMVILRVGNCQVWTVDVFGNHCKRK